MNELHIVGDQGDRLAHLPVLLAMTAVLPVWACLVIVVVLVPLAAQGWPALVRSEHDPLATGVITLTGVAAALTVALRDDFGSAGVVMALSVLSCPSAVSDRQRTGRPDWFVTERRR